MGPARSRSAPRQPARETAVGQEWRDARAWRLLVSERVRGDPGARGFVCLVVLLSSETVWTTGDLKSHFFGQRVLVACPLRRLERLRRCPPSLPEVVPPSGKLPRSLCVLELLIAWCRVRSLEALGGKYGGSVSARRLFGARMCLVAWWVNPSSAGERLRRSFPLRSGRDPGPGVRELAS